jgi:hypothetical protein
LKCIDLLTLRARNLMTGQESDTPAAYISQQQNEKSVHSLLTKALNYMLISGYLSESIQEVAMHCPWT